LLTRPPNIRQYARVPSIKTSAIVAVSGLLLALVGFAVFIAGSVGVGMGLLAIGWLIAIGFGAVAVVALLRRATPVAQAMPPGWFPDPSGQASQRYWDGTTWTDHTA
jgi:hypothetical protein